jgi:hypothetical protein
MPARAAAFDLVPLIGFVGLCVAAINVQFVTIVWQLMSD